MSKTDLRQWLKQARLGLSDNERLLKNKQICTRLEEIDWSDVRFLHCYKPITKLGEVDISAFIANIKMRYPHLQIYTTRKIDGVWTIVQWESRSPAKPLHFDVVIVPMLGFDTNLHRIGYGGGYYDRFLAAQKQAKKVGVCFEVGRVRSIPIEPHDTALDVIVTEANVFMNK
jgi:5-formyltetrahydrofolate cyclo-ligase